MTQEERRQFIETLETGQDSSAMEAAAEALAKSDDPAAVDRLGELLAREDVLARLDNLNSPAKMTNLARVLGALQLHPSPASANLCLRLLQSPAFLEVDDRKIFLLPALAAVRPMSEAAADVFRRTTAEGYFNLNVVLLVFNGSPLALGIFEEMIRDGEIPEDQRVDGLHAAVVPYRTDLAVLKSMDHLLDAELPDEVRIGVIETIFESQTGQWFGPQRSPPTPPAWEIAKTVALEFVLVIAAKVTAGGAIPQPLLDTVNSTALEITKILASRKR